MRLQRRGRFGSAALEAAMWIPLLVSFMMAMVELGRVSYVYFTLHKILYGVARMSATQPGLNFCDDGDAALTALKEYALRGSIDSAVQPVLTGLEASQIQIRSERRDPDTGDLLDCECSESGCDVASGGRPPDFIVVTVPDGYEIRLALPLLNLPPFPLRASVRVPVGGAL